MDSKVAYFPDALMHTVGGRSETPSVLELPHKSELQKDLTSVFGLADVSDSEISDELLLKQSGSGIKEALALLFRRYARLVRSIAYRIVRDGAEADDLVQEVFLYVYRKANLFDPARGTARSWIVQITYHRAIDRRRHLITRHFYNHVDLKESAYRSERWRTPADIYENSALGVLGKEKLQALWKLLSVDQKSVLELHFYEGYTLEEIAGKMRQPVGNIRNHYYRGLEKMRRNVLASKLKAK